MRKNEKSFWPKIKNEEEKKKLETFLMKKSNFDKAFAYCRI
jgi:hypothetical protein